MMPLALSGGVFLTVVLMVSGAMGLAWAYESSRGRGALTVLQTGQFLCRWVLCLVIPAMWLLLWLAVR